MAVAEKIKRLVWTLSAGRCAVCKKELVADVIDADAFSFLGEVAHINAKKDGGPRANSDLSEEKRDSLENLLLLCFDHHKEADDHPGLYTTEKMTKIRKDHLLWVKDRLAGNLPLGSKLQNYFYINMPRLIMLAEYGGLKIEQQVAQIQDLRKLGGDYIQFIRAISPVIHELQLRTVQAENLSLNHLDVGLMVEFEQSFRTKNVGSAICHDWRGFSGDMKKDPHIYTTIRGFKAFLPIDPRWITTTTAGVHLSSGICRFGGVFIINNVCPKKKTISASLLLLGHPKNPLMEALFKSEL